ncbi:MAG: hypothetical protein FH753_02110 [Firmicutes bacterium]|nr:hypothetical protein [Bacillota bacterium]
MDKEQLNESNIGRFITLNNQLSYEDPYVLKKTKEVFLEENQYNFKNGNLLIFVLTHKREDIGFIKFQCKNRIIFIDKLFVKRKYRDFEAYEMLLNINDIFTENRIFKYIKYIGVNDKPKLIDALKFHSFFMEKEHIQMEKPLSSKHEDLNIDLFKKSFHEVKDKKWIYNFMKECMIPVKFNYSYEEILQITKDSDDL